MRKIALKFPVEEKVWYAAEETDASAVVGAWARFPCRFPPPKFRRITPLPSTSTSTPTLWLLQVQTNFPICLSLSLSPPRWLVDSGKLANMIIPTSEPQEGKLFLSRQLRARNYTLMLMRPPGALDLP